MNDRRLHEVDLELVDQLGDADARVLRIVRTCGRHMQMRRNVMVVMLVHERDVGFIIIQLLLQPKRRQNAAVSGA
ncbi:hypothetical protein D3C84_1169150 [compost metagenome]